MLITPQLCHPLSRNSATDRWKTLLCFDRGDVLISTKYLAVYQLFIRLGLAVILGDLPVLLIFFPWGMPLGQLCFQTVTGRYFSSSLLIFMYKT